MTIHLSKIIDFWYDVIPTVTATGIVIICLIMDAYRKRKGAPAASSRQTPPDQGRAP